MYPFDDLAQHVSTSGAGDVADGGSVAGAPGCCSSEGGELQLARRAGVLLGPQLEQGFRDPAVDGPEAVQPRVAGGAEGDQGSVGVPRVAMMDHKPFSGPADAAAMVVAGQDFLAQAAEAGAGAAPAPVAGPTPPPVKESETPTGAAEGDLGVGGHKRTPIAYDKKHYHRGF